MKNTGGVKIRVEMKKSKKWFLNILLLICSIFFSIIITELILRLFSPPAERIPQHYHMPDDMAKYDISLNFSPKTHVFSDLNHSIWSNELGCFDKPYHGEKGYILLVGDSFTWGYVSFEDRYGNLIEHYLGRRVLNAGVGGYGTKQELFKIQKILKIIKNKPELIIVGHYVNDVIDDCLFRYYKIKDTAKGQKNILDVTSDNFSKAKLKNIRLYGTIDSPADLKNKIKRYLFIHSKIYHIISKNRIISRMAKKLGLSGNPSPYTPIEKYQWLKFAWEDHLNNLKDIKKLSEEYKTKLLIVEIPENAQIYDFLKINDDISYYDWELPNKILNKFFKEKKMEYLDLVSAFRKYANQTPKRYLDSKNDLYWRYDAHWNTKGNKLAALLIADHVINKNLVEIENREDKKNIIVGELAKFKK